MTETTISLSTLATTEQAGLILEPLLAQAVAANSAVATVHSTGATEFRIPRVDSDAAAAWTNEGEEITPSGVDVDEILVTPRKAAGLVPVSRELAEDSSPDAATLIGRSLSRALIDQVDRAFFGNLPAPAPKGLESLEATELSTDLTNLDGLLEARAAIAAAGGTATAILAHPQDALALGKLKDSETSNRALIDDVSTVVSLPVIQSAHATAGALWIVDSSTIHTVIREDVSVESSRDVYFSSDRVAIRATMRIDYGFSHPDRIVKLTIGE